MNRDNIQNWGIRQDLNVETLKEQDWKGVSFKYTKVAEEFFMPQTA
jgi:hypothetical protein